MGAAGRPGGGRYPHLRQVGDRDDNDDDYSDDDNENDDDVVGSVDELLSRSVLQQLRWCELASDVVFGAIWMPMGNLDKVRPRLTMQH